MENRRLPHLIALLRQRPHGKAILKGACEGTLRFYQSRQGVLIAVEVCDLQIKGPCHITIDKVEAKLPVLPLCQGYGCLLFLSDDFSLHDIMEQRVSLSDEKGTVLAEGFIRSWNAL